MPATPTIVVHEADHENSPWIACRKKCTNGHRIRNLNHEHWGDVFRLSHSVLPKVILPSLAFGLWASLVCVFYLVPGVAFLKTWELPASLLMVSVIGAAVSLLLVFRVNTAYDRFWEGRRIWSHIHRNVRDLARYIWVYCQSEDKSHIGAMHLLIAFAAATKHSLRNEPDYRYADVGPYVQHLKQFSQELTPINSLILPLEILLSLQKFLDKYPLVNYQTSFDLILLAESVSSLERVKKTPIPEAYLIHLKQVIVVYLLSLPFQLVAPTLGWFTIPCVFFVSIVLLGVEHIGGEIENPFGYDPNDLPLDEYCDAIRAEILQIVNNCDIIEDCKGWIKPFPLSAQVMDLKKVQEDALAEEEAQRRDRENHHAFGMLVGTIKIVEKVRGKAVGVVEQARGLVGIHRR